jgi:stage IV sporulation protein A
MEGVFLMEGFHVYKDIQARTKGEIYIGVVGPVRTGKSTFIKRFMDLCVLPEMEDEHEKSRTRDELPQSAAGRTIMTTEPKFIPKEAATIQLAEDITARVRLIDCVGYMVPGSEGHMEGEGERMVKTPWFEEEIPFTQAAELGTKKVIAEHSTIGIVVTCDGSFSDIPRENYIDAEERTVEELKSIGKPFVVLLNTEKPYGDGAVQLAERLQEKYGVTVLPINCAQLRRDDVTRILEQVLYEFPLTSLEFYMPKWVEMLPAEHKIKEDIIRQVREAGKSLFTIRDVQGSAITAEGPYVERMKTDQIHMDSGRVCVYIDVAERYYYEMLGELSGSNISGEYELVTLIRELSRMKQEYVRVQSAMESVRTKGYGVVSPDRSEIRLEEPQLMKQGNKYGVKIRSLSPSIHMIRANIETEIAPIVGSEEQAKDLITYIKEAEKSEEGIWGTNIFGKSLEEMVDDGIRSKIYQIGEESQVKLQDTMQKIVNESNGGLVCIII